MKRLLLAVVLVAIVAGLAVIVDPTHVLLGALRQESFYQNRPTSYWREQLCDTSPGVQANAILLLTEGQQSAVPVLIELLQEAQGTDGRTEEVRRSAAQALGHIGPPAHAAVPSLVAALDDADPRVRVTAAEALGSIGPASREAVPQLAEMISTDEPVRILKALRKLRGVNEPALPALIKALEHEDAEVRENAVEALGEIGPAAQDALPQLQKLREDPNAKVRTEAERAMERISND